MHTFFGIVKTSGTSALEAHRDCLHLLDRKFPSAFRGGQTFGNDLLDIRGDISRASIHGKSDLYLCGEVYNPGVLAPSDGHPLAQALLTRIESNGLQATVSALNGRFMICYLDHTSQKVQLLTDHLGVQQVFYHLGEGFLLFGSEIKFLLTHPRCPKEIDWQNAFRRPLPFEVLEGERNYHAWFKEIYLLEESTGLQVDLKTGAWTKHTYWNPHVPTTEPDTRSAQEVMDEYMDLLEDAVRIRVQDGDTAFSLLSGGLDSSIICALAARQKRLETFSVITQATMLEDTSALCSQLARDLQFKNTQFVVPFHRIIFDADLWKKRIWRAESPYNHTDSLTKTLLHDAILRLHPDIAYTLTGTGSDQLNGGLTRWIVNDADTPAESWQHLLGKVVEAEHRHHLPEHLHTLWNTRGFLHRDRIPLLPGGGGRLAVQIQQKSGAPGIERPPHRPRRSGPPRGGAATRPDRHGRGRHRRKNAASVFFQKFETAILAVVGGGGKRPCPITSRERSLSNSAIPLYSLAISLSSKSINVLTWGKSRSI